MAIIRVRALVSLSKLKSTFMSLPVQSSEMRRFSTVPVSSQFENVGFIGLGNMGFRMANNLLKAGYKMAVHDVNCNVMKMFSDMEVPTKETPFEVAEASDVVITMLPSSSHMDLLTTLCTLHFKLEKRKNFYVVCLMCCLSFSLFRPRMSPLKVLDVYNGPNGMLQGGNSLRPRLFIDSSTIDPQTSRKLAAAVSNCVLKEKRDSWENPLMLDAPVSGGVAAAEAGTLTFMVGGSADAYLAAKPLLLSMGKNTIFCGEAGTGSAAKICNNLAMAVSMLGVSEALVLGQSLGIAACTLTKIFNSSSARCWSSDSYNPVPGVMEGVPASRNYSGGFSTKLMTKDLNLASVSAKEVGLDFPLTSQAKEIYTKLCKDDHESEDFSCVFRHYYSGKDEL